MIICFPKMFFLIEVFNITPFFLGGGGVGGGQGGGRGLQSLDKKQTMTKVYKQECFALS